MMISNVVICDLGACGALVLFLDIISRCIDFGFLPRYIAFFAHVVSRCNCTIPSLLPSTVRDVVLGAFIGSV